MSLSRDIQYAIRTFVRAPGFTIVVVLTLALGIGASAAIFSLVESVVLQPLDYPHPDRLARITSELRTFGATDTGVSPPELFDYQARTDVFAGVAGIQPVSANVTGNGTPERIEMMLVSWNYFDVLGVPAALGRTFVREDDVPGVANIAVVSDAFWRRRLGADPAAVGRTITIDQDPVLIVGIMPSLFRHPGRVLQGDVDLWSPDGFRGSGSQLPGRGRRSLEGCLARLRPGVTLDQAQSRLTDYGADAARRFPSDYPDANGWHPLLVPLHQDVVGGVQTAMFVLLAGVGLVLLVACVNVAHLVLARSSSRQHEIAVRLALGAGARRLARQFVIESALLTTGGCAVGLLTASWTLRALIAAAPAGVPRLDRASIDAFAVAAAGLTALGVTILFSFGPLLRLRRTPSVDALKGGQRHTADGRTVRARGALVAAEVAMATALLVGAGLLVRTVIGLLDVPLGFETSRVVTARLSLPRPNEIDRATYLDPARRVEFYREALRHVQSIPGVERAAISTQIPLGGFNPPLFVEIEGRRAGEGIARPVMHDFEVSPDYFGTLQIPIVRGRGFHAADRADAEPVAIVSETAARMFWQGRDPIGQRVRFRDDAPWITVVGVSGDVLTRRLTDPPQPVLYRPLEQASDLSAGLLVRTREESQGIAAALAREVRAVDGDVPIYAVRTMDDVIAAALAERRFLMELLVAFAVACTGLTVLGIYGVLAFSVAQRTREIGIRIAMGAPASGVAWLVLRGGFALTGTGAIAGVAASLALGRLARSQLFGVTAWDPVTLAGVLILMAATSAVAAYGPARRAASVDPVTALRAE